MSIFLHGLAACAALAVLGVSSGCSTTHCTHCATAKEERSAVMCAKCEAVWVSAPHHINKTTVFRKTQKMACPDCTSAAEAFFKTGKLEHSCKSCGESLTLCPECK